MLPKMILLFWRYDSPCWPRLQKFLPNRLCDGLGSNFRRNKPKHRMQKCYAKEPKIKQVM